MDDGTECTVWRGATGRQSFGDGTDPGAGHRDTARQHRDTACESRHAPCRLRDAARRNGCAFAITRGSGFKLDKPTDAGQQYSAFHREPEHHHGSRDIAERLSLRNLARNSGFTQYRFIDCRFLALKCRPRPEQLCQLRNVVHWEALSPRGVNHWE